MDHDVRKPDCCIWTAKVQIGLRFHTNWSASLLYCTIFLFQHWSHISMIIAYNNIYWTKVKTLHLNCLQFIYTMMQASKTNESASDFSKTGLCITVKVVRTLSRGNTWKSFKCDRGPIFQVANLNRNLTKLKPSEIRYQPDLTARDGSLDMWQPEMWRTYHKCVLIV